MRRAVGLVLFVGFSIPVLSAEEDADKSSFNLFRPTPESLMRELVTDRPDKTESPITVDAGHFQLEMDFATYTYDSTRHETTKAWAVAPINFKVGILNNVDLQMIVEIYNTQTTRDRDTARTHRASGFGDVTLRCKTNFWGNDRGFSAFGMMPFVKLPLAGDEIGNGALEGGVILPLLLRLPADWEIETDIELFSDVSNESHAGWVATFDCGGSYRFTPNVQLDAGVNIGLTSAADDLNPFVGLSVRY